MITNAKKKRLDAIMGRAAGWVHTWLGVVERDPALFSLREGSQCSLGTAREALPSRDNSKYEKGTVFAHKEAMMVSSAPVCVNSERIALRINAACLWLKPRSWSISSWSNFCWKIRSYSVIYSISFLIKDGISGFSEVSGHRVPLWGQEFKLRSWSSEETSPLWSFQWHRWMWGCAARPCGPPPVTLGTLHPYSSLGP